MVNSNAQPRPLLLQRSVKTICSHLIPRQRLTATLVARRPIYTFNSKVHAWPLCNGHRYAEMQRVHVLSSPSRVRVLLGRTRVRVRVQQVSSPSPSPGVCGSSPNPSPKERTFLSSSTKASSTTPYKYKGIFHNTIHNIIIHLQVVNLCIYPLTQMNNLRCYGFSISKFFH